MDAVGPENIRADIERSLARARAGSIEIRFDGGLVRVTTDEMRWWRQTSEADIQAMADRLAMAAEDPARPACGEAGASSTGMPVDVLMPLKHGTFIRGDVVRSLLEQDRAIRWFVDAGPDVEITLEQMEMFAPAIPSMFWRRHAKRLLKILAKRNPLPPEAYTDVRVRTEKDGRLCIEELQQIVDRHEERFRLFVDEP